MRGVRGGWGPSSDSPRAVLVASAVVKTYFEDAAICVSYKHFGPASPRPSRGYTLDRVNNSRATNLFHRRYLVPPRVTVRN